METHYCKARYLDASVLLKVFLDEEHSGKAREYFYRATSFCSTSMCIMGSLGRLKAKCTYGHISNDDYYKRSGDLITYVWSGSIEIDEVDLFTLDGRREVERVAKKYSLDWSDALQIQSILAGRNSVLARESSTALVTADAKLAESARAEGIRSWNIICEEETGWAW